MTDVRFVVGVASEPRRVESRFGEAAKDPSRFITMFTTSPDIKADVAEGRNGTWRIRVEGPQFTSKGTAAVRPGANGSGSDIEIDIDLRGKGLLGFASPLLGLASGKIEEEASTALQREFGPPPDPRRR